MSKQAKSTQLFVNDLHVSLTRKRIKNIHLRIDAPDGEVRVSAPYFVSDKIISEFIGSKKEWILTQRTRILNRPKAMAKTYEQNEQHHFLGQTYRLNIRTNKGITGIVQSQIHLHTPASATTEQKKHYLDEWYRAELKARIPALLSHWQKIVGVEAKSWGVKKMKTKWGSCNIRDARIWLNLTLIRYPPQCLEYVLVHELVHLHETYHNARFYRFMDMFLPTWREAKAVLDSNNDL